MKIALLTSSRADFGIYLPLLKILKDDPFYKLSIIAFGTHLSLKHGETINEIINNGLVPSFTIDTLPDGDSPAAIASSMGKTIINFSKIWENNSFDIIIALGDRYEMFAACSSVVPFGIPIAHLYGGETTLGAIDDVFRNSITQMSTYHFTSTEKYKNRVITLKDSDKNVYNIGALSIDNLKSLKLLSIAEFKSRFNIDLSIPSILITFHPETVAFEKNKEYIHQLVGALKEISGFQFIITMPNLDTQGNMIRQYLLDFVIESKNAVAVESFGALGYLSCMKYCSMMLGNTSSGFTEAAYFSKPVINLGDRQKGRLVTPNIINCKITKKDIIDAVEIAVNRPELEGSEIYGTGNSATRIIEVLYKIINKNIN